MTRLLLRRAGGRTRSIFVSLLGRNNGPAKRPAAFDRYRAAAERLNLDGLCLFLSFDCDTDWDIPLVGPLEAFLRERGIVATYAVPGAQLMRGHDEYRALGQSGSEFMNHGARAHTAWEGDRYVPVTFYQEMSAEDVVEDIKQGHAIVAEATGCIPVGFRAPHFGGFQSAENLALIYQTIKPFGYRYASTTSPDKGLERGPAYRAGGVVELPTFGSTRNPTTILDSWTYLTDRRHYALGEEYFELFAETIDCLMAKKMPAVLTWYADPSHVWEQKPFLKAMDLIAERKIKSLGGRDLAALMDQALPAN